ncbi:ClpP/crotonase-like domain-containing protein [Dactylonectria estremocensis]|uniref:ClpP/crotonase-like domain-containing protein n=1 Tax=Dactylonectria estremocensis TaxID=1079267 RepID=A0A9P9DXY1_9HYPO|nr:ClpP/crotonase-like domain-containing protein [Dactylonectria estremocensis]
MPAIPFGLANIKDVILSFPKPGILLVTLNRPSRLNAITSQGHEDLDQVFRWFDQEPSMRCAILTGTGRAFCVGADLKEWNDGVAIDADTNSPLSRPRRWETAGFGGLSNRVGKKPVVAAVNGLCFGGGMEMVINCDLVVAAADAARFGLPEVKRGVVALAGALPRAMRTLGKQRASELILLGRTYSAHEMKDWGIVNVVIEDARVEAEAIRVAQEISANSPDSVITSREGLRLGWEPVGPTLATEILGKGLYGRMDGAENMKEGLSSFVEKRAPGWKDSKL